MKASPFFVLSLVVIIICACNKPETPRGISTDTSGVMKVYRDRVAGIDEGNIELWLAAHAKDIRFMDPDRADVVGLDSVRAWGKPFFDNFIMKGNEAVEEVEVTGNRAFIRYSSNNFKLIPKTGGKALELPGKGILLLRRTADGAWKVTHNIWVSPAALPK